MTIVAEVSSIQDSRLQEEILSNSQDTTEVNQLNLALAQSTISVADVEDTGLIIDETQEQDWTKA